MRMNWDYIAGFFDGEGCVSVYNAGSKAGDDRGNPNYIVTLAQSGEIGTKVLLEIKAFLEDNGIPSHFGTKKETPGIQRQHTLRIGGKINCESFLKQMLPRCIVKFVKTQDVVRYLKMYPYMQGHNFKYSNPKGVNRFGVKVKRRCKSGKKIGVNIDTIMRERDNGNSIASIARKYGYNVTYLGQRIKRYSVWTGPWIRSCFSECNVAQ